MKTFDVSINKLDRISDEMINNFLITAFEGGINYWCGKVVIKEYPKNPVKYASDVIAAGGVLTFHDAESEDTWELDLKKILLGIAAACVHFNYSDIEKMYNEHDAEVADVIVQYALFSEVKFG